MKGNLGAGHGKGGAVDPPQSRTPICVHAFGLTCSQAPWIGMDERVLHRSDQICCFKRLRDNSSRSEFLGECLIGDSPVHPID